MYCVGNHITPGDVVELLTVVLEASLVLSVWEVQHNVLVRF